MQAPGGNGHLGSQAQLAAIREAGAVWAQAIFDDLAAALGALGGMVNLPIADYGSGFPSAPGEGQLVTAKVAVAVCFLEDLVELIFGHRVIINEVADCFVTWFLAKA